MPTILIIDDKKDNLTVATALIKKLEPDYKILTAETGSEGIRLANIEHPDIILLDIHMPQMDGYEVCRRLRSNVQTRGIPIIFITAVKTSPEDRIKGLEIGGDAYLTKPIDESELLAILHVMLRIKKAEDERLQQYKDIVSGSRDLLALMDRDFTFLEINQAYADAFGKQPGDIIGKTPSDLFEDDFFEREIKRHADRCLKGETVNFQTWVDYPVYPKRFMDITFLPYIKANKVAGIVINCHDITNRKKSEDVIRESEEKYRGIFNESITAIYLFDAEKAFLDSNQAGLDLLGYTREEMIGMKMAAVDADPVTVLPEHDTLLSGNRIVNYEHRLKRKDGRIITVLNNSRPIMDKAGKVTGILSTLIDISEQKTADKLLKQSEKKFRNIFESFIDVYYHLDKDSIITLISPSISEYGYKPEDVVGTSGHDYYYDFTDRDALIKKLKSNGFINDYEIRFKDTQGKPVWASVNAQHLYDDEGNYSGLHAVLRDITERKRNQKQERMLFTEMQSIFNASPIPQFVVDSDRRVHKANNATQLFTHLTEDEMKGKRGGEVFQCLHSLDVPAGCGFGPDCQKCIIRNTVLDIFRNKQSVFNIETVLPLFDGSEYSACDLRLSASYFEGVTGPRVVIALEDITESKKTKQALLDSEEFNRSIMDAAGDAIISINNDGHILSWNKTAEKIFGYSEKDLLNKDLSYIIPQRYKRKHKAGVKRMINSGKKKLVGHTIELSGLRKDGTEFPVELSLSQWEKNNQKYFVGIIRDITERKQAEKQLKQSQEKYRATLESMDDLVFTHDTEGRFSDCYVGDKSKLAMPSETFIGKKVGDVLPPSIADQFDSAVKQIKAKGGSVRFDYALYVGGHKLYFMATITGRKKVDGSFDGVTDVVRDVTAQKQAEETLRESEKKFRSVIEQSNDGIYVLQDNRFVFINPRFTGITGYNLGEISSDKFNFIDIVSENGLKIFEERDKKQKAGEDLPNRYIFEAIRKDGQKRDMEVSVTTIDWENNPATLGILRDITDRIKVQKQLESALEKAQEGEKVKTLFMANMSHEIRTPLNSILGFTDLIEASAKDFVTDEEKGFFQTIKTSGQRLMRTIHKVLDISQIESGAYEISLKEFDLCECIREVIRECQQLATEKALPLSFKTTRKKAIIRYDEQGIFQSIRNIVENAIKYTRCGSININLKKSTGRYILSISDTGIGIAEEYLDNLFDAFSQESEGYTKKFQGIGLGMTITKRHLDLNNVALQVQSTKGVGTTFILTFDPAQKPLLAKPDKKDVTENVPLEEPAVRPVILVVEDDLNSQNLMRFFLKAKYDICCTVSVKEAKQLLKKRPVDLILLDLSLVGNEDGLDLVRWIRKTKTWKQIPVIATTAHAFTKDRDNCINAGCDDYLSKPIKREKLIKRMHEYI